MPRAPWEKEEETGTTGDEEQQQQRQQDGEDTQQPAEPSFPGAGVGASASPGGIMKPVQEEADEEKGRAKIKLDEARLLTKLQSLMRLCNHAGSVDEAQVE